MGLFVTEFRGTGNNGLPSLGSLAIGSNITVGASISTYALGANTNAVMISADAGAWVNYGSSTASPSSVGSSNAVRIPAGLAPIRFDVEPNKKLFVLST